MVSDKYTLQEPVEIRAHHLVAFAGFIWDTPSVEASLALWNGKEPEKTNYNGHGREFVEHEARTWDYLVKHPQTRIKVTNSYDVLCAKCAKKSGCGYVDDKLAAKVLMLKIGKTYTAQSIIDYIHEGDDIDI